MCSLRLPSQPPHCRESVMPLSKVTGYNSSLLGHSVALACDTCLLFLPHSPPSDYTCSQTWEDMPHALSRQPVSVCARSLCQELPFLLFAWLIPTAQMSLLQRSLHCSPRQVKASATLSCNILFFSFIALVTVCDYAVVVITI